MREYYPINIIINTKSHYCLWFSHDLTSNDDNTINDGLITELCKVKTFSAKEDLIAYTKNAGLKYIDQEAIYDFDQAIKWLQSKKAINCVYFLDLWNMVGDIANSLNINFIGNKRTKHISKIYDKLFWGCNLPAITPEGKEYIPIWTKKEIGIFTKIIKDELRIIHNFIQ